MNGLENGLNHNHSSSFRKVYLVPRIYFQFQLMNQRLEKNFFILGVAEMNSQMRPIHIMKGHIKDRANLVLKTCHNILGRLY